MKKILFVLLSCSLLLASCGKEKDFDENLTVAFTEMLKMWDVSTKTYEKLNKAVTEATIKDMLISYKHHRNVDEAMAELTDSLQKSGIKDSMQLYRKNFDASVGKLTDPPSSRKECYDEFVELMVDFNNFYRKYFEHFESNFFNSEEIEKDEEAFMEKVDKFQFKYAKYFKVDD